MTDDYCGVSFFVLGGITVSSACGRRKNITSRLCGMISSAVLDSTMDRANETNTIAVWIFDTLTGFAHERHGVALLVIKYPFLAC